MLLPAGYVREPHGIGGARDRRLVAEHVWQGNLTLRSA